MGQQGIAKRKWVFQSPSRRSFIFVKPLARIFMQRGTPRHNVKSRSKPRRERTQEYKLTPTCEVLGSALHFFSMVSALLCSPTPSRYRPIGRDRRGLLLGRNLVNSPGYCVSAASLPRRAEQHIATSAMEPPTKKLKFIAWTKT